MNAWDVDVADDVSEDKIQRQMHRLQGWSLTAGGRFTESV
jgi:hypothetical protein